MKRGCRYLRLLLVGGCLALGAIGCQVIDQSRIPQDDHDRLPWNNRAGWEDKTLGVPF